MLNPIDFAFIVGLIAGFALLFAGVGLVVRGYRESASPLDLAVATQRALEHHGLA